MSKRTKNIKRNVFFKRMNGLRGSGLFIDDLFNCGYLKQTTLMARTPGKSVNYWNFEDIKYNDIQNKFTDNVSELTEEQQQDILSKYKLISKNLDSIDFDNVFDTLHPIEKFISLNNLDKDEIKLYDTIIRENYDMLYEYRFLNERYDLLLSPIYCDTYSRHARYKPLYDLNISPLTHTVMILKILDILQSYQLLFNKVHSNIALKYGDTILKHGTKDGYPYMVIYNNSTGCVNGYIGLKYINTIYRNTVGTIEMTFDKYDAYSGYNNTVDKMHWIGFDTLHLDNDVNLELSNKYDSAERYNYLVERTKNRKYKEYIIYTKNMVEDVIHKYITETKSYI